MALIPIGGGHGVDSLEEFRRMQREMNRMLERMPPAPAEEFPPMNIWAGEEGIVVTILIPGVEEGDVEITLQEDTLTIKGVRRPSDEGKGVTYHRRERSFGEFARSVVLPYRVDADKADAMFDGGVLGVRLARPEEDRPQHIKITGL